MKHFVYVMGQNCTNGGITSQCHDRYIDVGDSTKDGAPLVFVENSPEGSRPGYRNLRKNDINGFDVVRVRAVPVDEYGFAKLGGMFGGHFVTSSDSRFPYESPVPVFDRFED